MQKLLVFFAGLLLSLSASAGVPVLKWTTGWEVSPISAGKAYVAQYYPYHVEVRSFTLPGSETVVGVKRSKAEFWLCPRDKARLNPVTEMCEEGQPDVCKSKQGQDFTLNWTLGYTRTPNIDKDPDWRFASLNVMAPSDGMVCDPVTSCKVALVLVPTATWQSVSPTSQGLYRVSVDYDAMHMGESCTPTDVDKAGAHPAADKPTCPGFVGEVNGVTGCYGNASNPTANDVPQSKPKPPEAGNPPAGKKPDTGEGSGTGGAGRTPATGDGGPAGGPAAAAGSGTKPDGTAPKPDDGKEQAACGAPGQPKCSINEAGTPDGKSAFDSANTGLDQNKDGWLAEISKVKDLTAPGWTWTFQLPSGCTPLDVPAFNLSLDVCRFQPIIHDIMSMLWAIATVMGCALMVFNATGKN